MLNSVRSKLGKWLGLATIASFIFGLIVLFPEYVFIALFILFVIGGILALIVYDWLDNIHQTEQTFRLTY